MMGVDYFVGNDGKTVNHATTHKVKKIKMETTQHTITSHSNTTNTRITPLWGRELGSMGDSGISRRARETKAGRSGITMIMKNSEKQMNIKHALTPITSLL